MRASDATVQERRRRLANLLREHAYLSTRQISECLQVSEATARRDLAVLAWERAAVRTYGGALTEFDPKFPTFHDRLGGAADAKQRIARRVRAMIVPGTLCFLDAGTTGYAVAQELAQRPVTPLRVVTNSLPAAEVLAAAEAPGLEVHLLGGRLLARQSVLLHHDARRVLAGHGPLALALLCAQAMDHRGLWNTHREVADFQRVIARQAERCFCLLDASKLGTRAEALLLPWTKVDGLVTDASARALTAARVPLSPDALFLV